MKDVVSRSQRVWGGAGKCDMRGHWKLLSRRGTLSDFCFNKTPLGAVDGSRETSEEAAEIQARDDGSWTRKKEKGICDQILDIWKVE